MTERPLELVPLDGYPRDLPSDRQLLAAFSKMKRAAYRATPEMLAEMAASKHLKLRLNSVPKSSSPHAEIRDMPDCLLNGVYC